MKNSKKRFCANTKENDRLQYNPQTGRLAFKRVYQKEIAPMLEEYEKERVFRIKNCILFLCIALILVPILIIATNGVFIFHSLFILILFIIFCGVYKKSFENKIKKKIMPEVCSCIGNINWNHSYSGNSQAIQNSGVVDYFTNSFYDDYFYGTYKDVNIEVIESKFAYNSSKTEDDHSKNAKNFDGVIIILDLNKKFKGRTIVTAKGQKSSQEYRLKKTSLEDSEFNKQYTVFTNDEVEARYLLTPSFMERLKNIKNVFQAKSVSCSFYQGKLYIALYTDKDLFALGSLIKNIKDPAPYYQMFDEIYSIMKLIKHFKLNEKTGL